MPKPDLSRLKYAHDEPAVHQKTTNVRKCTCDAPMVHMPTIGAQQPMRDEATTYTLSHDTREDRHERTTMQSTTDMQEKGGDAPMAQISTIGAPDQNIPPLPMYAQITQPHGNEYFRASTPYMNGQFSRSQSVYVPSAKTNHTYKLSPFEPPFQSNINHADTYVQPSGQTKLFNEKVNNLAMLTENMTLPKPELLNFNGNSQDYFKFITNFETNIANKVSDCRLKLSYLIQLCTG